MLEWQLVGRIATVAKENHIEYQGVALVNKRKDRA